MFSYQWVASGCRRNHYLEHRGLRTVVGVRPADMAVIVDDPGVETWSDDRRVRPYRRELENVKYRAYFGRRSIGCMHAFVRNPGTLHRSIRRGIDPRGRRASAHRGETAPTVGSDPWAPPSTVPLVIRRPSQSCKAHLGYLAAPVVTRWGGTAHELSQQRNRTGRPTLLVQAWTVPTGVVANRAASMLRG